MATLAPTHVNPSHSTQYILSSSFVKLRRKALSPYPVEPSLRFVEFSDTETTEQFVARDTEVELDLHNCDNGRVSTQIAFGHGGMNLMITGLTLRASLYSSDHVGGDGLGEEESSSSTLSPILFLL